MATKKSPLKLSINFNTAVYKEAAVKKAAQEYADFASFSFSRKGTCVAVGITPLNGPLPGNFVDEFANMALLNSI